MTIVRVNGVGWGVGAKLTSAQANALDINITNALDKRAGQTDTLQSLVSLATSGRIITGLVDGADADTTYITGDGYNDIRITSAVGSRTYTLGATNAVTGDKVTIFCEPDFAGEVVVNDQAAASMFLIGNTNQCDGQWATFIYVGGWRVYEGGQGARQRLSSFTATGQTVVVPRGITMAIAIGCGAGAGGGAGYQTASALDRFLGGGGGGAGAMLEVQILMGLTPGATLTGTVNAGGVGGTSAGAPGGDGGTTEITDGTNTWKWRGGGGGNGGFSIDTTPNARIAPGGPPISGWSQTNTFATTTSTAPVHMEVGVQHGGYGATSNISARAGGPSPQGWLGGNAGAVGTASGTYQGGGGGGGGGAGPFAGGGNGGSGGNGNNAGAGAGAGNGGNQLGGSGAGGGGGGAPGCGSGGTGAFGTGGNGATGRVDTYWVK